MCLLGYIAYGVHLCNKICIFQGKPENGPARHPAKNGLGRGLYGQYGPFGANGPIGPNGPNRSIQPNGLVGPIGTWPDMGPWAHGSKTHMEVIHTCQDDQIAAMMISS